jgi:hypothetical protein
VYLLHYTHAAAAAPYNTYPRGKSKSIRKITTRMLYWPHTHRHSSSPESNQTARISAFLHCQQIYLFTDGRKKLNGLIFGSVQLHTQQHLFKESV